MKSIKYNHQQIFLSSIVISLLCFFNLGSSVIAQTPGKVDTCIQCHKELGPKLSDPVKGMANDIHFQKGLSCADCHGGDPTVGFKEMDYTISMDKKKGYVGVPKPGQIPQFCAKCHGNADYMKKFNPTLRTDQLIQYRTSIHGQRNAKGDIKVAQCVSCHGVHGIRAVNDSQSPVYISNIPKTCAKCHANPKYMKEYKIPTDQYEKYKKSVHGIALLQKGEIRSAPACNSCHGNHGAAPPAVGSVIYACGQCHAQNQELYDASPHNAAFKKEKLGACEVCHGHHDVQPTSEKMIGVGQGAVCIKCHKAGDKGYEIAKKFSSEIAGLKVNIKKAEDETNRAAQYGRDVSIAKQKIKDAQDALIRARTVVHTVSIEDLNKVIEPANTATAEAVQADKEATMDLAFRYIGLTIFVVVALIVAILIYMKVRQLEK